MSVYCHPSARRFVTSAFTSPFPRVPRLGCDNKFYVACGDVSTLCKEGRLKNALDILDAMDERGALPVSPVYRRLLKGCINMKALAEGKKVHSHIMKWGRKPNLFLGNILLNMYAHCGSVADARLVFDDMPQRNVVSWTTMISGYTRHGRSKEALELFWQMQEANVKPNQVTVVNALKACACLPSLKQGKSVHASIMKNGFESDIFVGSTLVDMYAKCGSIKHAWQVFSEMPKRNVVAWNALLAGYAQRGHGEQALKLFQQMQQEGVEADRVTFLSMLRACARLGDVEHGKRIHACIIKKGFESDVYVGSTLLDMYSKCGIIEHAQQVFDKMPRRNLVSWNAMITGYANHGHGNNAIKLFHLMQKESTKPDKVTFLGIIKACANLASLEQGKQIHAHIIEERLESDIFVGSSLVDMYAKCGSMVHAQQVFDKMPKGDVIPWNAIIVGYTQHEYGEEVINLFWQMQQESTEPDEVTFTSVLKACASLVALEEGKQMHSYIIKTGLESDVFVCNALIDMYAKCGCIHHARQVFDKMSHHNVVSWTAMIAAYAHHGHGEKALKLVEEMQQEGVKLNHVTFTGVLSACSHAGLVDEGRHYFDSMNQDHGITPVAEHYACLVDLLGRSGHLEEAENFVKGMPLEPSAIVWGSLLGGCRKHCDVELARHTAECILELEPQDAGVYVKLSNIFAVGNMWDDKAKVRKRMKDRGVKKQPGCSWIDVNKQMHSSIMDDTSNLQIKDISAELPSCLM